MHENAIVQHLNGKFLSIGADAVGESISGLRMGHDTTVPFPVVTDDFTPRPLALTTADGLSLEAELTISAQAHAAVVLCHPHPQQGGTMTSLVTSELFRLLPESGLAVLRFNFRGVGKSEGSHESGVGEAIDIVAALDAIATECPDLPVFVSGWSFGADTSLSIIDPRIAAWIACAPPLRILPLEELTAAAGDDPRPKLLIIPEHDQFRDPESAIEATASWNNTSVVSVAGADHFFVGRTSKVAKLVVDFIEAQPTT
jgi:alpha/beta superfamily hydrolase